MKNLQNAVSTDHTVMKFLCSYRFQSHTSIDRQPKTLTSLMFPRKLNLSLKDKHNRAKQPEKFTSGDKVYAGNFSSKLKWITGIIIKSIGKVMY